VGTRLLRLYGLPKIHKDDVPIRPIVSNIAAPTYKLSKNLASLLIPLVGCSSHHVTNSIEFVHTLGFSQVGLEDLMVSSHVVSLFTQVPEVETLKPLSQHSNEDNLALFRHVLISTYFSVGGQLY
jgi:hypothetical protein